MSDPSAKPRGPSGERGPTSIKDLWRRLRQDGESLRAFARRVAMTGSPLARAWLDLKAKK